MLEGLIRKGFEVKFLSHAAAILAVDFPTALLELEESLGSLQIPITEIIGSGGGVLWRNWVGKNTSSLSGRSSTAPSAKRRRMKLTM